MKRHNERKTQKKGAVTLSTVEGSSAEACPPCFDGLSMTPFLDNGLFMGYYPLKRELGNKN